MIGQQHYFANLLLDRLWLHELHCSGTATLIFISTDVSIVQIFRQDSRYKTKYIFQMFQLIQTKIFTI